MSTKPRRDKRQRYYIDDYVGETINSWTVVGFSRRDAYRNQWWNVRCDCGYEGEILMVNLFHERSKSCDECSRKQHRGRNNSLWKGGKFISATFLANLRNSALSRNLSFNISIDDLEKKFNQQGGRCAYTGKKLRFLEVHSGKNKNNESSSASVDRVDSEIGYTPNNIQWVHKDINQMKWDLSEEEFLYFVSLIAQRG